MNRLTAAFCSRLPTVLLLQWSTLDYLETNTSFPQDPSLRLRTTLDTVSLILQQTGIPWCQQLACRHCLCTFKNWVLSESVIETIKYLQSILVYLRQDTVPGHTAISNDEILDQAFIPNTQTVFETLTIKGITPVWRPRTS